MSASDEHTQLPRPGAGPWPATAPALQRESGADSPTQSLLTRHQARPCWLLTGLLALALLMPSLLMLPGPWWYLFVLYLFIAFFPLNLAYALLALLPLALVEGSRLLIYLAAGYLLTRQGWWAAEPETLLRRASGTYLCLHSLLPFIILGVLSPGLLTAKQSIEGGGQALLALLLISLICQLFDSLVRAMVARTLGTRAFAYGRRLAIQAAERQKTAPGPRASASEGEPCTP